MPVFSAVLYIKPVNLVNSLYIRASHSSGIRTHRGHQDAAAHAKRQQKASVQAETVEARGAQHRRERRAHQGGHLQHEEHQREKRGHQVLLLGHAKLIAAEGNDARLHAAGAQRQHDEGGQRQPALGHRQTGETNGAQIQHRHADEAAGEHGQNGAVLAQPAVGSDRPDDGGAEGEGHVGVVDDGRMIGVEGQLRGQVDDKYGCNTYPFYSTVFFTFKSHINRIQSLSVSVIRVKRGNDRINH